jgi:hypothetical protein
VSLARARGRVRRSGRVGRMGREVLRALAVVAMLDRAGHGAPARPGRASTSGAADGAGGVCPGRTVLLQGAGAESGGHAGDRGRVGRDRPACDRRPAGEAGALLRGCTGCDTWDGAACARAALSEMELERRRLIAARGTAARCRGRISRQGVGGVRGGTGGGGRIRALTGGCLPSRCVGGDGSNSDGRGSPGGWGARRPGALRVGCARRCRHAGLTARRRTLSCGRWAGAGA